MAGTAQRLESVSGRRGPCPLSSLPGKLNFRIKFCHSTGIARSGGGRWGQGQHNKLCFVRGLIPQVPLLTCAPLGYFYNAPHWGGAISSPPPSDLRNYWTDSKHSSGIWKPWKNCQGITNFIDLGVTSDVTGQVKVKMFDISGLVTSTSKIAMLSTKKAN